MLLITDTIHSNLAELSKESLNHLIVFFSQLINLYFFFGEPPNFLKLSHLYFCKLQVLYNHQILFYILQEVHTRNTMMLLSAPLSAFLVRLRNSYLHWLAHQSQFSLSYQHERIWVLVDLTQFAVYLIQNLAFHHAILKP